MIENFLHTVIALLLIVLVVGFSFYWSTFYPNPIAQQIKRGIEFRNALLRSFEQSHPNLKDCHWQGPDIACK
jgi:hypothetical protein